MRRMALVTLVVHDYDEAIRFYTEALGFTLVEDEPRPGGSRWVVVEPGSGGRGGDGAVVVGSARSRPQAGSGRAMRGRSTASLPAARRVAAARRARRA